MPLPNQVAGDSNPLPDKSVNNSSVPSRRWPSRVCRFLISRLAEIVVILLICGGLFLLMWPACEFVRQAARNLKSGNNLREIGLAIYRFNDATGELPTNTFATDGASLLSWRVHILPSMGEEELYNQFHLDEPWDSPHNIRLLDRMPNVYVNSREAKPSSEKTIYRGFSSPGAVFERRPPRNLAGPLFGGALVEIKQRHSLSNFRDPLAATILVIEAGDSVEWTRPDDLDATPGKPFPKLGVGRPSGFQALMGDGGTRWFTANFSEASLRALITYNGGEQVSPDSP